LGIKFHDEAPSGPEEFSLNGSGRLASRFNENRKCDLLSSTQRDSPRKDALCVDRFLDHEKMVNEELVLCLEQLRTLSFRLSRIPAEF
jgi:hypothetical protein